MVQDKGIRVWQTLKNVKMFILGEVREVAEVKVSFTHDGQWSITFDEYNRIAGVIHEELRKKRKVYAELE